MDGIHDLGGRQGFGPVEWKSDEHGRAFHEPWQARTWAICWLMISKWRRDNNGWTFDWWRHVLERIDPADYLAMNYFDKLAQSCMAVLIDDGTANVSDFVGNVSGPPTAGLTTPDKGAKGNADSTAATRSAGDSAAKPKFGVGDIVKAKPSMGAMHTRLPAYVRGRSGSINACHGRQVLADARAKGEDRKEHLYTVAFMASDLWPESTGLKDKIYIDLWESYIEPAG
jgi:nitrile hydratase subunit beta